MIQSLRLALLGNQHVSSGATMLDLPAIFKWILIMAMFIGRIEILTLFKAIRGPKNQPLSLHLSYILAYKPKYMPKSTEE